MSESIWKDNAWRIWSLICVAVIIVLVSIMVSSHCSVKEDAEITLSRADRFYHEVFNNMLVAAFAIEKKSGYDAMRNAIAKTRLNEIVLVPIEEGAKLPKDLEQETVMKTLIDIYNDNAEKLGRPPYKEES